MRFPFQCNLFPNKNSTCVLDESDYLFFKYKSPNNFKSLYRIIV